MTILAEADRLLPPDCGLNFRDFGGYATAGGAHVRTGMLYRSGVMASVGGEARIRLARLGIVAICDLRSSGERRHQPTRWHETAVEGGPTVELWSRDYAHSAADVVSTIRTASDPTATRAAMIGLYRDMAYDHADSFRALFALLLAGRVPLLVNCSAGKDRTGSAVALVLSALGVPRETIYADYLLTARADLSPLLSAEAHADPRRAALIAPVLATDRAYLDTLFDAIATRSGSLEAYLADDLGVGADEKAQLRALLVDG